MKTLFYFFLLLSFSRHLCAQNVQDLNLTEVRKTNDLCGTRASEEDLKEIETRNYVGNNNALLAVLREHGFNMPEDYFDKLDFRGLYKGKELSLTEVKPSHYDLYDNKEILDEQTVVNSMAAMTGTVYYFPVKIWIHKSSTGLLGMSLADMVDRIQDAQEIFWDNGLPIQFYIKCSIGYVNSSPYYDIADDDEADDMFDTYKDNNALNIHGVKSANNAGKADGIPSISNYITSTSSVTTLAHELGHNFGLQHPHTNPGISSDDNGGAGNCEQEPVSRTMTQPFTCSFFGQKKCEVNADKLCDTPGDPNLQGISMNSSCFVTGSIGTDNWGVTWTPMTTNVMSYANHRPCRTVFSYGQKAVILSEIGKSRFSFKSTSTSYSISGPSKICPNQFYTFSTSISSGSPFDYEWLIPSSWTITGQGSSSVSIKASGATSGEYIQVMPVCGGAVARKYVEVDDKLIAITGPSQVPNESFPRNYSYYTEYYSGASYTWSAPPGWTVFSGQGTFSASLRAPANPSPGYVSVTVNNICGTVVSKSKYVSIGGGGTPPLLMTGGPDLEGGLFYPNPVTDNVNLISGENVYEVTDISIIDLSTGENVYSQETMKSGELINLSGLKPGFYEIYYMLNGEVKQQTLVKE